mmetsp:Transcript_37725/g.121064  ORF Transcript_37725/g.121064 Transcript_37725/m.121064 type:complete len:260 (+) Transcript_37725:73-852(+)
MTDFLLDDLGDALEEPVEWAEVEALLNFPCKCCRTLIVLTEDAEDGDYIESCEVCVAEKLRSIRDEGVVDEADVARRLKRAQGKDKHYFARRFCQSCQGWYRYSPRSKLCCKTAIDGKKEPKKKESRPPRWDAELQGPTKFAGKEGGFLRGEDDRRRRRARRQMGRRRRPVPRLSQRATPEEPGLCANYPQVPLQGGPRRLRVQGPRLSPPLQREASPLRRRQARGCRRRLRRHPRLRQRQQSRTHQRPPRRRRRRRPP